MREAASRQADSGGAGTTPANLTVQRLAIPDVLVIRPRRFSDPRGSLMETFRSQAFRDAGVIADFVQDNEAVSHRRGTLRGLHFQAPPYAQAKLVRVVAGAVLDVVVDLRRGSPSFGRSVGYELTAEGGEQMFVPRGFAHGYCTLRDDTIVSYKCDNYYAPGSEGGVHFADRDLAIDWGIAPEAAVLSDKDRLLPRLSELASPFTF